MTNLRDRYQIRETGGSISFRPFYHVRGRFKWYGAAMVVLAGLGYYFFHWVGDTVKVIALVAALFVVGDLVWELLFRIPVKYRFDAASKAVYRSDLIATDRKLMDLGEVVFFPSSEMGSWHYALGRKKNQFVKSYAISEDFGTGKRSDEIATAYEKEILDKIYRLIERSGPGEGKARP